MRRNKAVLRARPRERLIFIEFHSARNRTFVPMPTIANLSHKKLGNGVSPRYACEQLQRENAFVRYHQAQRERLARGMCF